MPPRKKKPAVAAGSSKSAMEESHAIVGEELEPAGIRLFLARVAKVEKHFRCLISEIIPEELRTVRDEEPLLTSIATLSLEDKGSSGDTMELTSHELFYYRSLQYIDHDALTELSGLVEEFQNDRFLACRVLRAAISDRIGPEELDPDELRLCLRDVTEAREILRTERSNGTKDSEIAIDFSRPINAEAKLQHDLSLPLHQRMKNHRKELLVLQSTLLKTDSQVPASRDLFNDKQQTICRYLLEATLDLGRKAQLRIANNAKSKEENGEIQKLAFKSLKAWEKTLLLASKAYSDYLELDAIDIYED